MANGNFNATRLPTSRRSGFTLLEVILALSLTGVVLMLLMTTIELFLTRVDSSRTQVEASQLARTLLAQIADDLRAARYYAPASEDSTASDDSAEADSSEDETEDSADETPATAEQSLTVLGIYGTDSELRIDRAAAWRWERLTREVDDSYSTSADEMPQTVRYFLSKGDPLDADELAEEGLGEEGLGEEEENTLDGYSGLSCQRMATAVWTTQPESVTRSATKDPPEGAELIAPEVVDIEFAYYDSEKKEIVDEWNSAKKGGLPRAVEITLKLAAGPRSLDKEAEQTEPTEGSKPRSVEERTLEYKLFVRLPNVELREKPPGPQSLPDDQSTEQTL
ncbi:MAG: prepilin-type N-terminal cleavage/methylation domain-containing protein [Planctomycetes bacterium]|nr:prepilin-type N-terminal cleavage/methylation domain-containing protein [Planctomycetota bacterium]